MKIEDYEVMRELRLNRIFNLFLAVICIFCLIFLVWGWVSTMKTVSELQAMTQEILGRCG